MFCPRCGIENPTEDVKFCRGCGEDLRLTSQALQKRIGWSSFLAAKLDDMMASRYRQSAWDGGINIFIALVCLMLAIYYMLTGQGALIFWVVISLSTLLGMGVGVYDVLIYKRSVKGFPRDVDRVPGDLSIFPKKIPTAGTKAELGEGSPTNEISPPDARKAAAAPSVTEGTTRHLEARPRQTQGER
jgi:hypothetical protein